MSRIGQLITQNNKMDHIQGRKSRVPILSCIKVDFLTVQIQYMKLCGFIDIEFQKKSL